MPTRKWAEEHPKIAGSVDLSLYQKFQDYMRRHNHTKMAGALKEILERFFANEEEYPMPPPMDLIADLKQIISKHEKRY